MATVTHAVATNVDTQNTPNNSSSFTPVAGDLLVVITGTSTSTSTALDGALTASANGITFSALFTRLYDSSTDKLCVFVANQLVPSSPSSMTVTWTPSDAGQQSIHSVFRIAGMQRTGLDAVRQFVANANNASGTAPSITFPAACLTGNPTILAVAVADSTPAFTAPSGWSESSDTGGTSPAGGLWDGFRNSGFTGTTVNWSSNAGGGYAEAGIEFDTSPPPTAHENLVDTFEHDTTGATNLTSGSISVETGDLLVVKGAITGGGAISTPTATGLTFTLQSDAAASESVPRVSIWTATCPSTTSVTVTASTTSNQKAFIVEQWRGMSVDSTPAIIDAAANPVPDQTITTEADDSVVTWIVGDWNESANLTPTYDGDGTTFKDFAEEYSGAWTWWAQHTYDLGTAGSKTISWSAPTSIDGSFAGLELQVGGGSSDATATPGVIVCTVAVARPSATVTSGPAVTATTTAMVRPAIATAAGPSPVAAVVALARTADNITAGPAAIPTSAAIGLAAAGSPTIVTPAAIACTVTVARPGVSTSTGPAAVAVVAALARTSDNVTAGPQTVAAVAALTRAAIGTSTRPSTVAAVAAVPRPGAGIGAGPLAVAAAVALARAAVTTTAGPATIAVAADVPAVTVQAGGSITINVDAIAVTVAVPLATPRGDAAAGPAGIPVGVTIPASGRAVTAAPAVVAAAVGLPSASAFEGAPVVVAAGLARVTATAIGLATYGVGYTGAATDQPDDVGTAAVAPTTRGLAEVTRQ